MTGAPRARTMLDARSGKTSPARQMTLKFDLSVTDPAQRIITKSHLLLGPHLLLGGSGFGTILTPQAGY